VTERPTLRQAGPGFYEYDAIGNFIHGIAARFQFRGVPCAIYAAGRAETVQIDGDYEDLFSDLRPCDVLLYHLSNDEPELGRLMNFPGQKVVYYHNVTPGFHFRPYAPAIAAKLDRSRRNLNLIAPADAVFANSSWSLSEVAPYLRVGALRGVMSPLTERMLDRMMSAPSPPMEDLPQPYILTVGRVVPHKNIIGGLRLFAELQKCLPMHYVIMGGDGGIENYANEVRQTAVGYGELSAHIHFVGQTSDEDAAAWFQNAAALLCMSRHEGFGVPLVEAMSCGVPVIALDQPAVRETLGAGGLLLAGEDLKTDAMRTAALLTDAEAVEAMRTEQRMRLAEIRNAVAGNAFWDTVTPRDYQQK
jgi:glycosyltransferase involved in cell wall biosynthesis